MLKRLSCRSVPRCARDAQGAEPAASVSHVAQSSLPTILPLLPQPVAPGHNGAESPARHPPFHSGAPSVPVHWLHATSWNVPLSEPWPLGKNAAAPPVSAQMSKCTGAPNWFAGLARVCPQNGSLLGAGHRSVTLTTIEWYGPPYDGEYGSDVPVSAKQRPQASPAPRPLAEPKESWLIAAENPLAASPHAMTYCQRVNNTQRETGTNLADCSQCMK
jgi:hypothetical protein